MGDIVSSVFSFVVLPDAEGGSVQADRTSAVERDMTGDLRSDGSRQRLRQHAASVRSGTATTPAVDRDQLSGVEAVAGGLDVPEVAVRPVAHSVDGCA
jgi:hypothetical protein